MIFASNNPGKIDEIKKIFKDYDMYSLNDMHISLNAIENGNNYYENALIKAKEVFDITKMPVIADDSGLEIIALNNWPNIKTHRICDDDYKRNQIILDKVKNLNDKRAISTCTLVYIDEKGIISANGQLEGYITDKIYEGNGFGYDKIFRLPDGRIIANLSMEEKNTLSARSIAAKKLLEELNKRG